MSEINNPRYYETPAERYAEHSGRIELAPTASIEGSLWAAFTAGIQASAQRSVAFNTSNVAFDLGARVGWMVRAAVALDPSLAPILDALTKEPID